MNSNTNTMEIQQQVRNNASELNDFLKGMKTWQQEMQAKDNQLLEAARLKKEKELDKTPSTRKLISPPPQRTSRKSDESQKSKKMSKEMNKIDSNKKVQTEKIKAYDYSGWDKFDVDKACDEIDSEEGQPKITTEATSQKATREASTTNSKSDNTTAHENQPSQLILKQQAVSEKELGNAYFKVNKLVRKISSA